MHICFFVEGYPYKGDPFMPFTRELISEISKMGVKCSVVVPQSITRAIAHKLPVRPKHWVDRFNENAYAEIYQPYTISLSSKLEPIAVVLSRIAAVNKPIETVPVTETFEFDIPLYEEAIALVKACVHNRSDT